MRLIKHKLGTYVIIVAIGSVIVASVVTPEATIRSVAQNVHVAKMAS